MSTAKEARAKRMQLLGVFRRYRHDNKRSPTIRELMAKTGFSHGAVVHHIDNLLQEGHLCRGVKNAARNLYLAGDHDLLDDFDIQKLEAEIIARQQKPPATHIFEYIRRMINRFGLAPSIDEIRMVTGIKSKSTIHWHINCLIKQNKLRRIPGKARAFEILEDSE